MKKIDTLLVGTLIQFLLVSFPASAQNACGLLCDVDWMTQASPKDVLKEAQNLQNVNGETPEGWTALGYVAGWGHLNAVRILLEKGANPNHLDKTGETPLHYAVRTGKPYEAFLTVVAGADPFTPDNEGTSPLAQARKITLEQRDDRLEKFLSGLNFVPGANGFLYDLDPAFTLRMWDEFGFDRKLDIAMLNSLASSGNSNAASYLSIIYSAGGFIPLDLDMAIKFAEISKSTGHPRGQEIIEFVSEIQAQASDEKQRELQAAADYVDARYKFAQDGRLLPAKISSGKWVDLRGELLGEPTLIVLPKIGKSFECNLLMRPEVLYRLYEIASSAADRLDIAPPSIDLCFITEDDRFYASDTQVVSFFTDSQHAEICLNAEKRAQLFRKGAIERNLTCGNVFAFVRAAVDGYLLAVWSSKLGHLENEQHDYEACFSSRLERLGEASFDNSTPPYAQLLLTVQPVVSHLLSAPEASTCFKQ